jgi:hypothetical protein
MVGLACSFNAICLVTPDADHRVAPLGREPSLELKTIGHVLPPSCLAVLSCRLRLPLDGALGGVDLTANLLVSALGCLDDMVNCARFALVDQARALATVAFPLRSIRKRAETKDVLAALGSSPPCTLVQEQWADADLAAFVVHLSSPLGHFLFCHKAKLSSYYFCHDQ